VVIPKERGLLLALVHGLTIARAALGFIFVGFAAVPGKELASAVVYLIAISADLLDGYAARRFGVSTEFGGALDVVSDRLVTLASVVFFVWCGYSPVACGLLTVRDAVMSGLRVIHVDGKPLVQSVRRVGGLTAMPIKVFTVAVLMARYWNHDILRLGFRVGIWILGCYYLGSLCISIWKDRDRIARALYGNGTEKS
jgi:phosphatidylglycerophosphate synthase